VAKLDGVVSVDQAPIPAATVTGTSATPRRDRTSLEAMRIVLLGIGIVVACFGVLWALQGFGVVGGSPMSNTVTWSIIGPIVALVGIGIAGFGARMKR